MFHQISCEVLDGVFALGKACMWMEEFGGCLYCFERAKTGYYRLFGEDSAKSVAVTKSLLIQTTKGDELIAELRALWERVKVSLQDEMAGFFES